MRVIGRWPGLRSHDREPLVIEADCTRRQVASSSGPRWSRDASHVSEQRQVPGVPSSCTIARPAHPPHSGPRRLDWTRTDEERTDCCERAVSRACVLMFTVVNAREACEWPDGTTRPSPRRHVHAGKNAVVLLFASIGRADEAGSSARCRQVDTRVTRRRGATNQTLENRLCTIGS